MSWREWTWSPGELLVPQVFPLESCSPSWVGPAWSPGNAENPAEATSEEGTQ